MYSRNRTYTHAAITKVIFIIIILLTALAPLAAGVRSARARVLSDIGDEDIILNRYANFDIGSILTDELIKVTIRNDEVPAKLLFDLRINFGGDWDTHYVLVSILKSVGSNETITFTNTAMLNYVADINDFGMSEGLVDVVGISDISQIANLTGVPEGSYSIEMTAYEVSVDEAGNVIESSKDELVSKTLTFNVVSIGDISAIVPPAYNDLTLDFVVPEIPVYDDARDVSTSSTEIAVSGPGVTYADSQDHEKSLPSTPGGIKGYPSDTDDGLVTYDLSGVGFRAGGTYTVEITYLDWNGSQITLPKTRQFTFATPRLSTAVDLSSPYQPEFSWSFSGPDYSSWVREYHVYVNGREVGTTADQTYVYTNVMPGTTYSWYVMPVNRDGTPFAASGWGGTFTTAPHDDIAVSIDTPADGAVLIAGEAYDFSGSAEFSQGAGLQSAQWTIGSRTFSGLDISYTPASRGARTARLTVVDSFSLSGTSDPVSVTVVDPEVSITGAAARETTVGSTLSFTAAGIDVAEYEWFVNGSSAGSGASFSASFDTSGDATVQVRGTSAADMDGNTRTVESDPVTVTAVGAAPQVAIQQPESGGFLVTGTSVQIEASVSAENRIESELWSVSGPADSTASGSSFTFSPGSAGQYQVRYEATDIYGKKDSESIVVNVITPAVAITNIDEGDSFALSGEISPVISAPNAIAVTWFLDDVEITADSYSLSGLSSGRHTLHARAEWRVMDASGNRTTFSKESERIAFEAVDLTPPDVAIEFPSDGDVLMAGESYRLDITLNSDSPVQSRWVILNGARTNLSSFDNVSYAPATGGSSRSATIGVYARNSNGIEGSDEIQVQIAEPRIFVTEPADLEVVVGARIPLQASVSGAGLFWLVDGSEVAGWNRVFTTPGTHTVQAGWRLEAMGGSGSVEEFTGLSDEYTFTAFSQTPPVISGISPTVDTVRVRRGDTLSFAVTVASENAVDGISWMVYRDGSGTGITERGMMYSHLFDTTGEYRIQARAVDAAGLSDTMEWNVRVIDPSIAITTPAGNAAYGLGAVPSPVAETRDIASVDFSIDGADPVADDFDWNSLEEGTYTLTAIGTYVITGLTGTVTSAPVNFSVQDLSPPEIPDFDFTNGTRLIAGQSYNFNSGAADASVTWYIDGTVAPGGSLQSLNYTPDGDDDSVEITVQAVRNGVTASRTVTFEIVDPYIELALPEELAYNRRFYPAGVDIPLRYQGRDLDDVTWRVDYADYSGKSVNFESGTHAIEVIGTATGVLLQDMTLGDYELFGDNAGITERDITIVPVQGISISQVPVALYSNETGTVSVAYSGDNQYLRSLTYAVDGNVFRQSTTARSAQIPVMKAGRHRVTVTAVDVFGRTSLAEAGIDVYDPVTVSITSPAGGSQLSPDEEIAVAAAVTTGRAAAVQWLLDGRVVEGINTLRGVLGTLEAGNRYTITVRVTDARNGTVEDSVNVEVQSDFQLNLLTPEDGAVIVKGNDILCRVGLEKVSGSQIDLSDAAGHITWYVDNREAGTGLTYTFDGETAGDYTIRAEYSKNGMTRTTSEAEITVRDLQRPEIVRPVNGQRLLYAVGDQIQLEANGEPGATYTWKIGSRTVAVGKKAVFVPSGISGNQQLRVTTTAYGLSRDAQVTFNLEVNTPPALDLAVPPVQFTGEALEWNAIASDIEDNPGTPALTLLFDGVEWPAAERDRLMTDADIGRHTLTARAVDSHGVATSRQAAFVIESSDLGLNIQSPGDGDAYIIGYAVPLKASLESGDGVEAGGSYSWTVQYMDVAGVRVAEITGKNTAFEPEYPGEVLITGRFTDADGRERGEARTTITVEERPVKLSIYWPHGKVVNAGDPLSPELVGLPEDDGGTVAWAINGASVDDISALTAPAINGEYVLSVQYRRGDNAVRAEVGFMVNTAPEISVTNPKAGEKVVAGKPVVLSAVVEDDQPFSGAVTWADQNGSTLGAGNPLVLDAASAGAWTVTASATDRYGASATAERTFTIYNPLSVAGITVNGGYPTYRSGEGLPPLTGEITLSGGIEPTVTWRLAAGGSELVKNGPRATFTHAELQTGFLEKTATLSVTVEDDGLESSAPVYTADYLIAITANAVAEFIQPAEGDVFWVGDTVPLALLLGGYNDPTFSITVEGVAIDESEMPWTLTGNIGRAVIPAGRLTNEGIYDISVSVNENGSSQQVPLSLNIYTPRTGIFIDEVPEVIDLNNTPGMLEATVSGIEGDVQVQWRTDLQSDPVGFGTVLDLSSAGLVPGQRALTAEAVVDGETVASTTVVLQVLGDMSIAISPETEPLIIQRGASLELAAAAADKDGTAVTGEAVSWSSHIDGLLTTGESLNLADFPDIHIGEHIITVEVTGADGTVATAIKTLLVNPAPQDEDDSGDQQDSGDGQDDGAGAPGGQGPDYTPPQNNFSPGMPMPPVLPILPPFGGPGGMGPGGGPPNPGMGGMFNDFMGGFPGGGFGGFGF